MPTAVVGIGTELARGEVRDANGSWLARELTGLGAEVTSLSIVDDDQPRITHVLSRLAVEHTSVVVTGGLGPTTDDLTRNAAADLAGVRLVLHPPSLEALKARFAALGRPLSQSNLSQAQVPEGAEVLPNPLGTAAGFSMQVDRARLFFLPGVPEEMRAMFRSSVAPCIASQVAEAPMQIRFRTFGKGESWVNDALQGIEAEHGVKLAYLASYGAVDVKILAPAQGSLEAAADAVRHRLGNLVFAEGDLHMEQVVAQLLLERRLTLGVAESCTGGHLSQLLTRHPGASLWFRGGVVTYANRAKTDLLGVPKELLERVGAVSEPVARAMAEGARCALLANLGIGITGIAGPEGGTDDKPVGTVHLALATGTQTIHLCLNLLGDRGQIQQRAASAALDRLRRTLLFASEGGSG